MGGIRNICKLYGQMRIQGRLWLWDYVADEPVPAKEMPHGSERRKASDKARAELMRSALPQD